MHRLSNKAAFFLAGGGVLLFGLLAWAQAPRRPNRAAGNRPGIRRAINNNRETDGEEKRKPPPLPSDPRLLSLHKQFLSDAEKLAVEYEKDESWDRAKAVYQEILKLIPQHAGAKAKLQLLLAREANAQAERFTVQADEEWQDTLIEVQEGRPVTIRAGGSWTFNLSIKVGPEGIQIPKELREYNMGCLLGVIRAPGDKKIEPFVVGSERKFVADRTGRLFLRMYDVAPDDNEGEMAVEVRGTYRSFRRDSR